jgi:hypothetical protein
MAAVRQRKREMVEGLIAMHLARYWRRTYHGRGKVYCLQNPSR